MTATVRVSRRWLRRRSLHRLARAGWLFVVLVAFVADRSALLWPLVIAAFAAGYAVCSWRARGRVPRRQPAGRPRGSSRAGGVPRRSARTAGRRTAQGS
jgi:hypothetical protein